MTSPRQQSTTSAPPPQQQGPTPGGRTRATTYAGLATICSALALTSVVQGISWLGFMAAVTILISGTGLLLRVFRLPSSLVGLGQLLVLLLFVTTAFMTSGILGVVPGPTAFGELTNVLAEAAQQIRTTSTPIEATPAVLCLITITIGFVAIIVDTVTVTAAAPAVAGIVLLGMYAVPATLSNELLPWWTFVLPAGAFVLLLTVSRAGQPPIPHRIRTTTPVPALTVVISLVSGLAVGASVTAVGTDGTLPGTTSNTHDAPAELGISPFTSLRGMLDHETEVELFRVQGMADEHRLLRAFTLDTYRPNEGWGLPGESPTTEPHIPGSPVDGPLPRGPGDHREGENREIRIEPIHWNDIWLPVYGAPRELRDISTGWHYDPNSGNIHHPHPQRPNPYVEIASLQQPDQETLRQANSRNERIDSSYTDASGIDPRVTEFAQSLTRNKTNDFDRTKAIWQHFQNDEGFVYDTETAPTADQDAIADFLFHSKRGFCEQFASSMAVMLRAVDIPSRVAIGFTEGRPDEDDRVITSQDAHAWVEVYFDDFGWVNFDPTPLSAGRGTIPPYLQEDDTPSEPTTQQDDGKPASDTDQAHATEKHQAPDAPEQATGDQTSTRPVSPFVWVALLVTAGAALIMTVCAENLRRKAAPEAKRRTAPTMAVAGVLWGVPLLLLSWWLHPTVALVVLPLMLVAAIPRMVRKIQENRRLAKVTIGHPHAAERAWEELRAECVDRGLGITDNETVRLTGHRITQDQLLDQAGVRELRSLISAVEHSWYSLDREKTEEDIAHALQGVRESLRRHAPLSWRNYWFPRSILGFCRGLIQQPTRPSR